MASFLGSIIGPVETAAGHALNAGNNLINYGSLHAPTTAPAGGYAPGTGPNSLGSQWVTAGNYRDGNLAPQNTSPTKAGNTPVAPSAANSTVGTGGTPVYGNAAQGGTANPNTVNEINQTYDPLLNTYQSYLNNVAPWQQQDTNLANQAYTNQGNTYQDQYNAGNANLDQQTKVLNDSYQRSLQQLGNNIRNQFQGQINSLGVGGAGDSSANQMSAYALAQEQNLNRGYMNTDLNNQLTQIGLQRNDLQKSFGDEMAQLNTARDQALSDISKQYYQLQQTILNDLQSTETAKKNAMLWTNSWAANQVAGVDQNIGQQVQALNSKYSALAGQSPQNLSYQPNYQATSITAPTVGAQATTSQQVSPSAPLAAPGYNSNNQDNSLPLAAVLSNNNQYQNQTSY